MLHGFQLHLVSESPLAWQDGFALKIAVYHEQNSGIIIHIADNDRQGVQSGKLCSVLTAMPGDDFIATLRAWAGDQRRQHAVLLYAFYAAPQPPGHPVLPRGRLELDLLFQRPVCRRHRHRALAVAGAAAALNIFCQKALTTANAHDRITDDFERRRRTGSFQSNFPMDRPAGLRPYGQPGPLPTGGASRHY